MTCSSIQIKKEKKKKKRIFQLSAQLLFPREHLWGLIYSRDHFLPPRRRKVVSECLLPRKARHPWKHRVCLQRQSQPRGRTSMRVEEGSWERGRQAFQRALKQLLSMASFSHEPLGAPHRGISLQGPKGILSAPSAGPTPAPALQGSQDPPCSAHRNSTDKKQAC